MTSPVVRNPQVARTKNRPPRGTRSAGVQLGIVLLLAIGGIWGTLWWQDRPIRTAAHHIEKGNFQAAYQLLSDFLQQHPNDERALALKARILVQIGQPQQAIKLFERVGASDPKDMHAWAQAYLRLEQWTAALPMLEFVKKSGIDRADVLHELAACRMKLGDAERALEDAKEFAQQPGCEVRGQLLIGTIHQQRGNLRQAASAWSQVLKLSPELRDVQIPPAEFLLEYGRVLLALGEPALAETYISRNLEMQSSPGALVSLGEAQFQLGKSIEAKKSFEEAMQGDSYSVAARKGLANLSLAAGDFQKTIDLLLPLEKSGVLTSEIAFLLQRSYARLKDEAAAKRWQEKTEQLRQEENVKAAADQILRDTPDSDWATVIRAYKYANQGNWTEAETLLKSLGESSQTQPFIRGLTSAVKSRGRLPSLQGLPIQNR